MTRLLLLTALLCGCTSVPEATWQTVHAVDVVQTARFAHGGRCQEEGLGTRQLIGANPGVAGVIGWGIASAGVHYAVTRWLDSVDAPQWVRWTWQSVTIGIAGEAVLSNAELDCY